MQVPLFIVLVLEVVSVAIGGEHIEGKALRLIVLDDAGKGVRGCGFEVGIMHEDAARVAALGFFDNIIEEHVWIRRCLRRITDAYIPIKIMPALCSGRFLERVGFSGVVAVVAAPGKADKRGSEADVTAYDFADSLDIGNEIIRVRVNLIVVMFL